ncbi:hypothetical protein ANN_02511 [Periplaneta americana]|uniref:Uncharacterized protein n=1 Tax=Periplaneta americana TaxID=6978 RepID=A0ABQ8TXM1_PERAM|nr:hypothetical protein ANN_02511 [Periplaneta americana]
MNKMVSKDHPSIYHLLEYLQNEVAEIRSDIERLESGHSSRKKKKKYEKYLDLDKRIKKIVANYQEYRSENRTLQYLRTLGIILQVHFELPQEYFIKYLILAIDLPESKKQHQL